MKLKFILSGIVGLILSISCFAQTTEQTYYVTIGVYSVHPFAIAFTEKANKNNFSAQYAINPARKLYYVYVFSTTDKVKAIAFMLKIRVETEYKEAWVFSGSLGDALVDKTTVAKSEPAVVKQEPVKQDVTKPGVVAPEIKPDTPKTETKPAEIKPEPMKKDSVAAPAVVMPDSAAKAPVVTAPVTAATEEKPVKHEGQAFVFRLSSEQTGELITGEVRVQESSKASQYQAFRGNEIVYVKAPANANGSYTIITNAPGYKQIKETVNFKDPMATAGVTKGDKNEFIVPFALKFAKTGDYIDFNNVKFIRNSSIMTAESEAELDGLVALMKEKATYKIKIHGHCNGKGDREIVALGTSTNFFGMDPRNKKESASATKLSEERANSVKEYLVSKGIGANRIATKGEGGKIPLYPSNSTLNAYNDRVEIEVKKN